MWLPSAADSSAVGVEPPRASRSAPAPTSSATISLRPCRTATVSAGTARESSVTTFGDSPASRNRRTVSTSPASIAARKGAYIPVYNRCGERHLALPLLVVLDKSPLGSRFRATVKEGRGDLFWCAWNVDALVILRRLLLRSGSLALRHTIEGYAIKSRYGSRLPSMPRTTAAIWSSVSSSR